MSFVIPDPRWEEPNLLIPGNKPTGPVVIDWTNTITRGLKTALPLSGEGGLINLANDPLFPNGWEHYSGSIVVRDGVECSVNNSCVKSVDVIDLADRQTGTSMMTHRASRPASEPNYYYFFFSRNWVNHSFACGGITVSGEWIINSGNKGSVLPDYTGVTQNSNHVIAFSWDYLNDYYEGWLDGDVVIDTATRAHNADYYAVGGRDDSTVRYSNGVVQFFFMWDRQLTQTEQISMARDPYQFLIPQ